MILTLVAVAAVLLLCVSSYARLAPVDEARWHVDPERAPVTRPSSSWRAGPPQSPTPFDRSVLPFPFNPSDLARAIDRAAMAEPRARRLSASADGLWTTYEHRSAMMGFPDYTSVKISGSADRHSELVIFGRSRFGRSDFGVNRQRIDRWIDAVDRGREPATPASAP